MSDPTYFPQSNSSFLGAEPIQLPDIILSWASSLFMVDYGVVTKINSDKTIDVQHVVNPVSINGTVLPPYKTTSVEVMYPQSACFGAYWPINVGDVVLLLGTKDFVSKTADVTADVTGVPPKIFSHYQQRNLKAIPLSGKSSKTQKVKIDIDADGNMSTTATKINLNGDSKSLVTWGELDTALSNFKSSIVSAIETAIAGHTHAGVMSGGAVSATGLLTAPLFITIDISASKTTTVKTGG